MHIDSLPLIAKGLRLSVKKEGREVARARLYFLSNDLHDKLYGFMEDVFVEESSRGEGFGSDLVGKVIEEAKKRGCYKLICTSRHENEKVHRLYERLGFKDHGKEYRIDF